MITLNAPNGVKRLEFIVVVYENVDGEQFVDQLAGYDWTVDEICDFFTIPEESILRLIEI